MIEVLGTFCAGTFFGAAVYINLVQHTATIQAGSEFAGNFFSPMYRAAAPMQVTLAIGGTVFGGISWYYSGLALWLVGAVLLFSVVPITLLFIKPINDQLLQPKGTLTVEDVAVLLRRWNSRHWVRSIVSGASFLCFLVAQVSRNAA